MQKKEGACATNVASGHENYVAIVVFIVHLAIFIVYRTMKGCAESQTPPPLTTRPHNEAGLVSWRSCPSSCSLRTNSTNLCYLSHLVQPLLNKQGLSGGFYGPTTGRRPLE